MRILLLGSGAREHAILRALQRDAAGHEVIVAPGNAGIARDAETVAIDPSSGPAAVALALTREADLVIIGPEAPLIAGVADALREHGIPVFGPSRGAAAIEGSKAFAKRIMAEADVPTGGATLAGTLAEAEAAIDGFGAPYVIKADGLAAGKGVLVTTDRDAAIEHTRHWLEHGPVLIEEFLGGREVSLFFVSDGSRVVPLSPAQDFKRLGDGDLGPNTGGMGAYSPLPWLDAAFGSEAEFVEIVQERVALPVVRQLAAEGTPFIGLLYCGLIIDGDDIRVIEFNARFGDPETQVVLPRLTTPFGELLAAAAAGTLDQVPAPEFAPGAAVTVVVASAGYPESAAAGRVITGIDDANTTPDAHVVHAATTLVDGDLLASGGRVLSVVGVGETIASARERAYAAADRIHLDGSQSRRDIAAGIE